MSGHKTLTYRDVHEAYERGRRQGHAEARDEGLAAPAILRIIEDMERVEGESAEGGYMWDAEECANYLRERIAQFISGLRPARKDIRGAEGELVLTDGKGEQPPEDSELPKKGWETISLDIDAVKYTGRYWEVVGGPKHGFTLFHLDWPAPEIGTVVYRPELPEGAN